MYEGKRDNCGFPPHELIHAVCEVDNLWLRVYVFSDKTCRYAYSVNGVDYIDFDFKLKMDKGQWIGAKVGLFCINPDIKDGAGWVDIDYFRVEKLERD